MLLADRGVLPAAAAGPSFDVTTRVEPEAPRSYVLFSDIRDGALFACCVLSLFWRARQHRTRERQLHHRFTQLLATVEEKTRTYKQRWREWRPHATGAAPGNTLHDVGALPSSQEAQRRGVVEQQTPCAGARDDFRSLAPDRQSGISVVAELSQENCLPHFEASEALENQSFWPIAPLEQDEPGLFHSFILPDHRVGWNASNKDVTQTCRSNRTMREEEAEETREGLGRYEAARRALLDDAATLNMNVLDYRRDALSLLWDTSLESRLEVCVNWLSVVSNCLTYFLRPSQVLYTFLFCNADFFLFVMAALNKLERTAALQAAVVRAQRWRARLQREMHKPSGGSPGGEASSDPSQALHGPQQRHVSTPLVPSLLRRAQREQVQLQLAAESRSRRMCGAVRRRLARVMGWLFTALVRGIDAAVVVVMEAAGFLADVLQTIVPAAATAPSPAFGVPTSAHARRHQRSEGAAAAQGLPVSPSSSVSSDASSRSAVVTKASLIQGAPSPVVSAHAAAAAAAEVSPVERWLQGPWALVLLNALFTAALVTCHQAHLFFSLGALAGYLASAGTLILLGQEAARVCLAVRVRCCTRRTTDTTAFRRPGDRKRGLSLALQKILCVWRAGSKAKATPLGTTFRKGGDGGNASNFPPVERISAPSLPRYTVPYLLEHLFASGCGFFYLTMLYEEGPALWSTHTEFMRWYTATVAVMVKELLLCIPTTDVGLQGGVAADTSNELV